MSELLQRDSHFEPELPAKYEKRSGQMLHDDDTSVPGHRRITDKDRPASDFAEPDHTTQELVDYVRFMRPDLRPVGAQDYLKHTGVDVPIEQVRGALGERA